MSKLERMIDIIDTMLDGRRRTGVELSYKYGVCRNTIYRDISQLSTILPIVTYYGGRYAGSELLSMNSFKYGLVQKSEIRYKSMHNINKFVQQKAFFYHEIANISSKYTFFAKHF